MVGALPTLPWWNWKGEKTTPQMFQSSSSGLTPREELGHCLFLGDNESRTHRQLNWGRIADDFSLLGKYHGNDA